MERDEAWKRVFERLPVLESLERDGIFYVTADELKAYGGREPRLMAKVDTLAQRPAILAEHELAIFPVRNGRYALFPDPDQKSFFRFTKDAELPLRPFRSKVDLNLYDTFPRNQEASESQALDFAYISTLLPTFCGEPDIRLTLRGRFFSGGFSFRTPIHARNVAVDRVQIEVDAGYEGTTGIYLIEAKRGRRDNFHIRQLWYPWLHWSKLTRKRVIPIFFTYSNGQYFLSELSFDEQFGDLQVVRNRAYCLDETPLAEVDFQTLLMNIPVGFEPADAFPQANDMDKLVDMVQAMMDVPMTKSDIAELFDFDDRQGDYYGNAACFLGLLRRVDGGFSVTEAGLEFGRLRSRAARTSRLVAILISMPTTREAIQLLVNKGFRLEKIANDEIAALIRKRSGLSGSTPERRASTLRAWLGWIMSNVKIYTGV